MLNLPLYTQNDDISGKVKVNFGSKSLKHYRILIQLIGETESFYLIDKPDIFLSRTRELKPAGAIMNDSMYSFRFLRFEKPFETYYGRSGRIRYYLKVLLYKGLEKYEQFILEFAVQLPIFRVINNQAYRAQLRIDDFLMINAEINKSSFSVDDCIIGKLCIEELKLVINSVQVSLVKREIFNPSSNFPLTEDDLIIKFEVSNKCPKKGEIIPFKLPLSPLDLSPTIQRSSSKLLTKYILNISFIDQESRSLFKPIEIDIWRRRLD